MAREVRFFVAGRRPGEASGGRPCPFGAEPDASTHARFLLHRAPERCVEVFDCAARRRALYRFRGERLVALAEPP